MGIGGQVVSSWEEVHQGRLSGGGGLGAWASPVRRGKAGEQEQRD